VATRAGGALEIITDGVDGLLTPPGDASALGNALHDLLADPEKTARLAQAGTETARTRFSISTSARDVLAASTKALSA
jgi:glycosyltransferase involved in cell wall biosynthesis